MRLQDVVEANRSRYNSWALAYRELRGKSPRWDVSKDFQDMSRPEQEAAIASLEAEIDLSYWNEELAEEQGRQDELSWGELFGELIGLEEPVRHTHRHSFGNAVPF